MVPKIVSEHVKKNLSSDDAFSKQNRNEIQGIREKLAYAEPIYRPPPKPKDISMHLTPRKTSDLDIDSWEQDINIDLKQNSTHQEGVIWEMYQRQDKSYFEDPPELQG